jgi:hypothetical protein
VRSPKKPLKDFAFDCSHPSLRASRFEHLMLWNDLSLMEGTYGKGAPGNDTGRYNAKFDLVIEGYSALDGKLDNKFDVLNGKIEHNSFLIHVLNQKIDHVDTSLSAKIDDADARLSTKIDDVDAHLSAKIDNVDARLSDKIDGVAADLKAHRADTEVHRGYRVKED